MQLRNKALHCCSRALTDTVFWREHRQHYAKHRQLHEESSPWREFLLRESFPVVFLLPRRASDVHSVLQR